MLWVIFLTRNSDHLASLLNQLPSTSGFPSSQARSTEPYKIWPLPTLEHTKPHTSHKSFVFVFPPAQNSCLSSGNAGSASLQLIVHMSLWRGLTTQFEVSPSPLLSNHIIISIFFIALYSVIIYWFIWKLSIFSNKNVSSLRAEILCVLFICASNAK